MYSRSLPSKKNRGDELSLFFLGEGASVQRLPTVGTCICPLFFVKFLLDGHFSRVRSVIPKSSSYRELVVCGNASSIFNFTKMLCGLACSCFYTSHKQKKCCAVWRKKASCYGKEEALFQVLFF